MSASARPKTARFVTLPAHVHPLLWLADQIDSPLLGALLIGIFQMYHGLEKKGRRVQQDVPSGVVVVSILDYYNKISEMRQCSSKRAATIDGGTSHVVSLRKLPYGHQQSNRIFLRKHTVTLCT